MSRTLAKAAVLLACLGLFACGDPEEGGAGGAGATPGAGGAGGSGGDNVPVTCGDGIEQDGEECDDGNTNNADRCLDTCRLAKCGDGEIREFGSIDEIEECDDGANNSDTEPNACRTDCTLARCGDGVMDEGEGCDEGGNNSLEPGACRPENTVTQRGTWDCQPAQCGDGIVDPGEECDDGNDDDNDFCRNDCTEPKCGDGVIDAVLGEECDDGNTRDDDLCSSACTIPTCGDGLIWEGVEECDPQHGDAVERDGCTKPDPETGYPGCKLNVCGDGIERNLKEHEACEPGVTPGCHPDCTLPTCGDGWLDREGERGEACDDGNNDGTDACNGICQWATCGDGYLWAGVEECDPGIEGTENCRFGVGAQYDCTIPRCMDGFVDEGEACDDGNRNNHDSCTNKCLPAACGDGYHQPGSGEECDPSDPADPNREMCHPPGFTNPLGEDYSCRVFGCGDGIHQPELGEACDDGNNDDNDGCRNDCSAQVCHDGIRDPGEQCDDGNEDDDDACVGECMDAYCGDGFVWAGVEECDPAIDANCNPDGTISDLGDFSCKPFQCGDGVVNHPDEECDDGNDVNEGDSCRNDCSLPVCGDGIADNGEACDDGNNGDQTDGCLDGCILPTCGDGYVWAGVEECDPGVDADCNPEGTVTDRGDFSCMPFQCGDGAVNDPSEECDDGNEVDGDGCRADCTVEVCGDFIVDPQEQCDDNDDNTDDCVACRFSLMPIVFEGYDELEEGVRREVSVTAQLDALAAVEFDMNTMIRTQVTVTQGGAPVPDLTFFYDGAGTGGPHWGWTDPVTTDVDGQFWFGPAGGTSASAIGLDTGSTVAFSVPGPAAGTYDVTVALFNVNDPANPVLVGSDDVQAVVSTPRLSLAFTGFDDLTENVASSSEMTATLDASVDPATQLTWRLTFTDEGGAPATGVLVDGTAVDGSGQITLSAFPASDLQVAGGATIPLPLTVDVAGSYELLVELVDITGVPFGQGSTQFLVGFEPFMAEATTGFDTTFGTGIRKATSLSATLDTRYPDADGNGDPVAGEWRVTVSEDATGVPVEGVSFFFYDGTNGDPADHETWTGGGTTDAAGQLTLDGETLAGLKAGATSNYSVAFPTVGTYDVTFELVADGQVVDAISATATVQPALQVAFGGFGAVFPNTRRPVFINARLHPTFNSSTPVRWRLTLTENGVGVDGIRAYYELPGDSADHLTWTAYIETMNGGVATFGPAGGFPPSDTTLQQPAGADTTFSVLFPNAGSYSLNLELVLGADETQVVGAATHDFTVN